jgi:hypothetical protein
LNQIIFEKYKENFDAKICIKLDKYLGENSLA